VGAGQEQQATAVLHEVTTVARFFNTYSPQTEIGQGLNAAISSLFAEAPNERSDRLALARLRESQVGTEEAQQRKLSAEAEEQEALNRGRARFRESAMSALPGVRLDDVMTYLNTGRVPTRQRVDPFAPIGAGSTGVPAEGFTPDIRRRIETIAMLDPLMQAGGGRADQLAKALDILMETAERGGVIEGEIDPTRYFQANLKPVTDIKGGNVFNPAVPATAIATPETADLADALVGTRNAQAGLYGARTETEGRRQRLIEQQALTQESVRRRNDAQARKSDRTGGEKPKRQLVINSATRKALEDALNTAFIARSGYEGENVRDALGDKQLALQIFNRAAQLFADPESESYGQPDASVESAMNEIAPEGFEVQDIPFWPDTPNIRRKGGAQKQPAPATQQRQAGKPAARPAGKRLPQPKTKREYDALPAGSKYVGTDGKKRVKGGS